MSNDLSCFTFVALVWPVTVEAPRNASPGGYKSPHVKEALSLRSDMLCPPGSRARDAPPSSEASSSSEYS